MAYLIVSLGGQRLRQCVLKGPTLLGRSVDADIAVRDASLSRWHCRFEPAGDPPNVWTVVDLGSRNGTFLNGRRVHRAVLHDGDLLRAGRTTVAFHTGTPPPEPPDAPPAGESHPSTAGRAPAPSPHPASAPQGFAKPLLVLDSRLPRPNPVETASPRPAPAHDPVLSSPGWSRQPGKKPPAPSVDLSPAALSPNPESNTVDLIALPQPTARDDRRSAEVPEPPTLGRRIRQFFGWLFGR